MATKSLNQSVHFKAWQVLAIGIVLGALGYFFYLHAFAARGIGASKCLSGGAKGEVSIVRGVCVGGDFDGSKVY